MLLRGKTYIIDNLALLIVFGVIWIVSFGGESIVDDVSKPEINNCLYSSHPIATQGFPPLQPASQSRSQSVNCCSERETVTLFLIMYADSTAATVEKAQQQPQLPWSLGGFTFPAATQSTWVGAVYPRAAVDLRRGEAVVLPPWFLRPPLNN